MECRSNKAVSTVTDIFLGGVQRMGGFPSRVRGDYGTENNGVEWIMKRRWGVAHRGYLRGK